MEVDKFDQNKKLQLFELILVVGIAFYQSIIYSIQAIFSDKPPLASSNYSLFSFFSSYVNIALSISLMLYLLKRQGKTISNIGVSFPVTKKDLGHSFGIFVICILTWWLAFRILYQLSPTWYFQASHPKNLEFMRSNYIGCLFLYVILAPLKEELIVRGYLMEQVMEISNKKNLAILVSIGIQFSYHLYQGLPSAVTMIPIFSFFALYYAKSGNLNPIIIAHISIDLMGLLKR